MTKLAFALSLIFVCVACDLSSKPDSATDASIAGLLVYDGLPPTCDGGRVRGRFIFQLYQEPAPLPFDGVATPVAVRIANASILFDPSLDCGLANVPISRMTNYRLDNFGPNRTLLEEVRFHLTVVFDHDENLEVGDPIRGQPNRDDIFGAAYQTVESRVFSTLRFGPTSLFPEQALEDVDITVDANVWSEVPAFRVTPGAKSLSAEATLPDDADMVVWEDTLHALTDFQLQVLPADQDPWRTILAREGISLASSPPRGFWSRAVDPIRILNERPHPIFGQNAPAFRPAGLDWLSPFTVLKRVRSAAEVASGVPDVYLVPLPRPTLEEKQVFSPTIDMLVAPAAIIDLDPELGTICQIPYIAPGNFADEYEGAPTECQEIPTGSYDVSVQHGVAGGVATSVSTRFSDIGLRVDDDEYIGQHWTIPNELGSLLSDQGEAGRFVVADPNPGTAPDHEATDYGHGMESCTLAPDRSNPTTTREVSPTSLALACCANVAHLCGIPLCEAEETGGIREVAGASRGRPNCMPFLIPSSCCLGL